VINLAPDKSAVFREIARVLKPGGRLAVSDIALKKPLPPEVSSDVMAYVGCIAGAILVNDYKQGLIDAGFSDVQVIDSGSDLNAYAKIESQTGCCSPAVTQISNEERVASGAYSCCAPAPAKVEEGLFDKFTQLLQRYNVNDYAASVKVFAVK
jgi:hypothetical protein